MIEQEIRTNNEEWRTDIIFRDNLPEGYDDAHRTNELNDCRYSYEDLSKLKNIYPNQKPIIVEVPDRHFKGHNKLWLYYLPEAE